jgi:hypothetical protein
MGVAARTGVLTACLTTLVFSYPAAQPLPQIENRDPAVLARSQPGPNFNVEYSDLLSKYPALSRLGQSEKFDVKAFANASSHDRDTAAQQGVEFEQEVNRYVNLGGRISGNQQVTRGSGKLASFFDSNPSNGSLLKYGRFQGQVRVASAGNHFVILGEQDTGDNKASSIEGKFSSRRRQNKRFQVDLSGSVRHDFKTNLTSSAMDVRSVVFTGKNLMVVVGAEGSFYGGGAASLAGGQFGPVIELWLPKWDLPVTASTGYGSTGGFGLLSLSRSFNLTE